MSSSIRIIRYDDLYRDQVAELQTYHWHPDPEVNARMLDWKYRQNPYRNKGIYLAVDRGVAVGMRGLFGTRWQCDGLMYDIPSAGDLVINPEYRNRGLFKQIMDVAMAELAQQEVPFVFNFSGGTVTHLMSRSLGWMTVGNLEELKRQRGATTDRALRWQNRIKKSDLAVKVVRWFRGIRRTMAVSRTQPFCYLDRATDSGQLDLKWSSTPMPEKMSQLVVDMAIDGRIKHVRDDQYFAWRFGNPLMEYRFGYCGSSPLDGYIILGTNRYGDGREIVTIVDWEGRTPAIKEELLESVVSTGRIPLLTIWGASLGRVEREMLERRGFYRSQITATVSSPFRTILVGRTAWNDSWLLGERDVLDLANWDVRRLYSDGA